MASIVLRVEAISFFSNCAGRRFLAAGILPDLSSRHPQLPGIQNMSCHQDKTRFKSKSTVHTYTNTVNVVEPIAAASMAVPLVSFSVTVDSTVATAEIVVDDKHRHLSLHWGDDLVEVINLFKLRNQTPRVGAETQEPNTLKFQHVYQAPFNQGRRILIAVTEDFEGKKSYDSAVIEIDRRYKLSFRNIVLEFPDHLDSFLERYSEIESNLRVAQNGSIFFHNDWDEDVETVPIHAGNLTRLVLNNSAFTREISYSDNPISVYLYISERDGISENVVIDAIWDVLTAPFRALQYLPDIPAEFDPSVLVNQVSVPFDIHPRTTHRSTTSSAIFRIPDREGKVYAHFSYDLELIIPLDRSLERKMTVS